MREFYPVQKAKYRRHYIAMLTDGKIIYPEDRKQGFTGGTVGTRYVVLDHGKFVVCISERDHNWNPVLRALYKFPTLDAVIMYMNLECV